MHKSGFGGSCHWCTEAIFRSLKGVGEVEQGWIGSSKEYTTPSEAVVVHFDPGEISLETLIAIHLHTHSCTAQHSMREKYRSAIYYFNEEQSKAAAKAIEDLKQYFRRPVITRVLPFVDFKLNEENYLNYYYNDPTKPFCQNIVNPKLKELLAKFSNHINSKRLDHLRTL